MLERFKIFQQGSLLGDIRQLFRYVSPRRKGQLALLLCLMLCSAFSEVVSLGAILPFLSALSNAEKLLDDSRLQPLISTFSITSSFQLVTLFGIGFVVIMIATNLIRILTLSAQTYLGAQISSDLTCLVYQRTLLQPYIFHTYYSSHELLSLVSADAGAVGSALGNIIFIVTNSFIVLALAIGLFWINATVALITTCSLSITYMLLYRWRRRTLISNSQRISNYNHRKLKTVQESLGGIRDLSLAGSHRFFLSSFTESNRVICKATVNNSITTLLPHYTIEMVAMTAIVILALNLGRNGDFSQAVPVLGGFALGAKRLLPALQQAFAALTSIQGVRISLQKVLIALQRPVDSLKIGIATPPVNLQNEIRFVNVWFRYRSGTAWVLKDLDLLIPARTTVGFVGTTGSGKSTTADLILGLLQPEKGQILVDGSPLVGERVQGWQSMIAHVPQSIFLSDTTIAENIAFGIPPELIDEQQILKATKLAQLSDFIDSLPERYNTVVGERGIRLSGGQRQRIGIARALYRRAQVIVFDEATSALDNATEKEVMDAIEGLSKDLTIILIAHRLTTVEKCDCIFEFSQGQVVASGTYSELLARSVSFQRMALR